MFYQRCIQGVGAKSLERGGKRQIIEKKIGKYGKMPKTFCNIGEMEGDIIHTSPPPKTVF